MGLLTLKDVLDEVYKMCDLCILYIHNEDLLSFSDEILIFIW
jgi:hypothetical protein